MSSDDEPIYDMQLRAAEVAASEPVEWRPLYHDDEGPWMFICVKCGNGREYGHKPTCTFAVAALEAENAEMRELLAEVRTDVDTFGNHIRETYICESWRDRRDALLNPEHPDEG